MTGTLADMTAVARAVASMDAVVHLAAEPNECDFITRLLPSNFIGVYNVLEAARVHGVKRVVLASSIHAVFGIWDNKRLIRMEDGTSVKSHYGVSKVFAEQLGYMYNQRHGLSVIAVRIGWFTRNAAELRRCKERGWESMFFSHRDCADFFTRCVETPDVKYEVLMATSKHPLGGPGLDLEPARRVIGYEPQDEFGEGLTFDASGVTG
jgi:nucleoside-diphosphate-sugar epimerase